MRDVPARPDCLDGSAVVNGSDRGGATTRLPDALKIRGDVRIVTVFAHDTAYSGAESQTKLSIVIRARNEAQSLKQVFDALVAQQSSFRWELIVVDNESEDETRAICEEYGARTIMIARDEFTYGRALNRGVSDARGDLVLIMSAHALPIGPGFLESAVAPFVDPMMAAVRCLWVNNHQQLAQWYKPRDIHYHSIEEQRAAEYGLQWTYDYPAATCCVIRRSVWEQTPFDEQLEANEDKLWMSQALGRGFKVRSCAAAPYLYTRKKGSVESRRKLCRDFRALYRISGYVPLTWPGFCARVVRSVLLSPLVAAKYIIDNVAWAACLVSIPCQAKAAQRVGSLRDYDKRSPNGLNRWLRRMQAR